MSDEAEATKLLDDAIDALALGYPFDKSEAEKDAWISWLRDTLEVRGPAMRARMREFLRTSS